MSAFFDYEEITPEEENELIEQVAEKIHEYKMETVAILTLESVKPLAYVGGEMSRVFLAPFLPILGREFNDMGEKYITVFEERDNIEKLIQLLEQKVKEEEEENKRKKQERAEKKADKGVKSEKKGWMKWWPF
ncbi:hypothetical protein GF319_15615 [Candidatus Bathyarchaeota archaeon]|nr:hypothetical protein [Candidatus Bathyarchaeota archaeon]